MFILKKGVGALIGWVLLLGFVISIGTMVFLSLRTHTTELSDRTVNYISGRLECSEININVVTAPSCSSFSVTNRGVLNIDQVAVRIYNGETPVGQTQIFESVIAPHATVDYTPDSSGERIEVIPIVLIDNKPSGCLERRIIKPCG
ncbi:hypothetical protein J4430_02675 [Candidatus Woesearchaeota archaeon]|nr:hypothetical protein [Candidatus Woesearchaeota archaeon]